MEDHRARTPESRRFKTGVRGLDVVLDGGLLRGGTYLLMGLPGTGKTTLATQIAFNHAARGGRVTYVTMLAESHAHMLSNLEGMAFFDATRVGDGVTYVGAYITLRESKLAGVLELIRRSLREDRSDLLIIDGLSTTRAYVGSDVALKEFIAELQILATMSRCTTLMLANLQRAEANEPEHSMVDGMIELTVCEAARRTFREIQVLKFRGSAHLLGRHDLEITSQGIVVRPCTEEVLSLSAAPAGEGSRGVSTGIGQLDAMLDGGLVSGSSTMLLGFTGSGKTTVGAHFLAAGAAAGEPCLYFGFYESPDRFVQSNARMGIDLAPHVESGLVRCVWQPPLRYGLDELAERLLEDIQARGVRRVVIDGVDGFRQAASAPERPIRFLTALVNELRSRDVTAVMTEETLKLFGPDVEVRIEGMSALVDNIVLLEYVDFGVELRRLATVIKARGSRHESQVRELYITDRGVQVSDSAASAREVLEKRRPQWIREVGR